MARVNNKRILKNTLFLYIRMIVVMAVSLYTVRAILHQLGVVDYGIYNVVGGVVSMFTFINHTLTSSSQRYFSIELAKGDKKKLNLWFCLNITTFSFFILVFLVIAETIGLWFVNTQMVIPKERMFAANVVYQLSILAFCIHFFSAPYNALIIAHEKMSAFAYISIIEAFLKLLIVLLLSLSQWDKLIVYGFLMFLVTLGITFSYIIYNLIYFEESKYHPYWNTLEIKELLSFSGWHFFGTFSTVIRSQGINILLNLFFNPAVNAARAIAFQVYYAVSHFSNNFFTAVKPQIYKSYAAGEYEELFKLIQRSTIICTFLVSLPVFPVLTNSSFILGLWLDDIPDYAIIFTQLVLINGMVDAPTSAITAAALATGKIKRFQGVVALLTCMNLPLSYIALKIGAEPTATMYISITLSIIACIVRARLLHLMIGFPFFQYLTDILKLILVSLLVWTICYFTIFDRARNIIELLFDSIFSILLLTFFYVLLILRKQDRMAIKSIIYKKYKYRDV